MAKHRKLSNALRSDDARQALWVAGVGAAVALSPLYLAFAPAAAAAATPYVLFGGQALLFAGLVNTVRARRDEARENRKAADKSFTP